MLAVTELPVPLLLKKNKKDLYTLGWLLCLHHARVATFRVGASSNKCFQVPHQYLCLFVAMVVSLFKIFVQCEILNKNLRVQHALAVSNY